MSDLSALPSGDSTEQWSSLSGEISSENGSITVLAMLFCIVGISAYLKVGAAYFAEHTDPMMHKLVVVSLSLATIFTLGCMIHMLFLGAKSKGQLKRLLKKQVKEIRRFTEEGFLQLERLDSDASHCSMPISPRTISNIKSAQRILAAMERRATDVEQLVAVGNKFAIMDATELINEDLDVRENCVNSLIQSDPIRPLPANLWFSTVEKLLESADKDIERIESSTASAAA